MSTEVTVEIFDTTLRDGAQSLPEANQFPVGSKPEIANRLAMFGVNVIEAGFPRAEGDREQVQSVAETAGNTTYMIQRWGVGDTPTMVTRTPVIAGLSRTTVEDIETTWGAVQSARLPRIHTFISTDPEHMTAKFPGKHPNQVLAMGRKAIRHAKAISEDHPGATVEFSAEAATTTRHGYLERVTKTAVDEGADVINFPDTVGQMTPREMFDFYSMVIKWVHSINPDVRISAHPHNDGGFANANGFGLVEAAMVYAHENDSRVNIQLEGTVCGIGERAGQLDIFPIAERLYKSRNTGPVPVTFDINPILAVSTARDVMGYGGMEVGRQSPIVGRDVKVHRSGIHSDGIIKGGHKIYTPFDPTEWGHTVDAVHEEGRYQGRAGRKAARINQ